MSEMLRSDEKYASQQKVFAKQELKKYKADNTLLTLRCRGNNCKKVLGKVNIKGELITESSRSGSWIKTIMKVGKVECKKCGNILNWNSQNLNRRT